MSEGEDKMAGKPAWHIDRELVEHVALLSRIELTDNEKALYAEQLSEVMKAFSSLDELDALTKEEGMALHAVESENIWREDKAAPSPWDPLSNSSASVDGYVKGPRIL